MTIFSVPQETIVRMLDDGFDAENFGHQVEELLMELLVEEGRVSESHYYELKEVYFALEHLRMDERLESRLNVPVMEADHREMVKALLVLAPTKGEFPYVEEHGVELEAEDRELFEMIREFEAINNRTQDILELLPRRDRGETEETQALKLRAALWEMAEYLSTRVPSKDGLERHRRLFLLKELINKHMQ